jgi:hypothetical protein
VVVVDGSRLQVPGLAGAWDLVIFLRQPGRPDPDPDRARVVARYLAEVDPERAADVVVEHDDPGWPVIRRIAPAVAGRLGRDLHPDETRAFFAPRAASWEERFPGDDPAYAAAVADLGLRAGQTALDAGCGTGRALPHLRRAVGPGGVVLGRQGRRLREDDTLAHANLRRLLERTGWRLDRYNDGPDRFLAVAERIPPPPATRS